MNRSFQRKKNLTENFHTKCKHFDLHKVMNVQKLRNALGEKYEILHYEILGYKGSGDQTTDHYISHL